MTHRYSLYQVDAFTKQIFKGNPAAVCVMDAFADEAWMQALAAEMNLSETAFVCRRDAGFDLRWFTPTLEVDLCGHATLASAHVLWQSGLLEPTETAVFHTRSGELRCDHTEQGIAMRFPLDSMTQIDIDPRLEQVLGAAPAALWRGATDLLVELGDVNRVREMVPDLVTLKSMDARGLIVTAWVGSEDTDFVSRFFGPAAGIDEDPVTGSAHCSLADYWHQKTGKTAFKAEQVSARGGRMNVRLEGQEVVLLGDAVTVFETSISASPDMV